MYERTSTIPKRAAEHLKMEKVPVFLVGDVGEGREHTLSTATAFEKGLFHTKNCFCTCYTTVYGVFVVQRYQIGCVVFGQNKC